MPSTVQLPTGRVEIDGILSGVRWSGPTVSYGFPDSASDYPAGYGDEPSNGFFATSVYQQDVVRYAFSLIESYTNLAFTYAGATVADVAFGQTSLATTAYAIFPGDGRSGDVWFGNDFRNPRVGDYAFLTHLHEIGHALGLKHPHEANGSMTTLLPAYSDWLGATVMSYRDHPGGALSYTLPQFHYPTTFMPLDILALQTMYGADYTTHSGGTVYSWSPTTGQQFVNGVGQAMPGSGSGFAGDGAANFIFMTVWDGGGIDTYDFSNYGLTASQQLTINLEPGSVNQLGNGTVTNSYLFNGDVRSLIENAVGSVNRDYMTGNQANNRLEGRDGDDYIDGGYGNDAILGGAGNDQLYAGFGADLIDDSAGYNTIRGGPDNDTVRFNFNFMDAMIRFLADGSLYVGTANGFSIIDSAETLRFADGVISVAEMRPGDTVAPAAILPDDNIAFRGPDQLLGETIDIRFSEEVALGTGDVRVYFSDGTLYRTYAVADLWTDDDTIRLDLPTDEGQYYALADSGIVTDMAGNPFAGITSANALNFYVGIRADDFPQEPGSTSGAITINGPAVAGYVNDYSDTDTFRLVVTPGQAYRLDFLTPGVNGATGATFEVRDSSYYSTTLASAEGAATAYFTAATSVVYVVVRTEFGAALTAGDFSIQARTVTDDLPGDASTTAVLTPGGSRSGTVHGATDTDWIRVELLAGQTYRFTIDGTDLADGTPAAEAVVMMLTRQEDGSVSYNPLPGSEYGAGGYSLLKQSYGAGGGQFVYTADRTGTYYIQVQSQDYGNTGAGVLGGGYTVDLDQGAFASPDLVSFTPSPTGASPADNIVLTFDRAVVAGEGFITISGDQAIKIDIRDSSQVRISGNTVTIDPADDLPATDYYVGFDPGALVGTDGTFAEQSIQVYFEAGFYDPPYYGGTISSVDDYSNDTLTLGRVVAGGVVHGTINLTNWSNVGPGTPGWVSGPDSDWFRTDLVAGQTYDIQLLYRNGDDEPNQYTRDIDLQVYDSTGTLVVQDTTNSGGGLNSRLLFTATQTGTYYIAATASQGSFSGQDNTPPYEIRVGSPSGVTRTGTNAADSLQGTAGFDRLNGGAGADTMAGGAGDDTYVVDNAGDVVTEAANAGIDTVESSITYVLGANVERLKLIGTAAIDGTGNSLANTLTGNSAVNVLNGMAGADAMAGGVGNDTYIVDNVGDTVLETSSSGGIDTVNSSVTFTLGAYVENLILTGSAAINGTGNSSANEITGTAAANVLNGGAGADRLVGGLGNDTYVVDNAGDLVVEAAGAGTDLVQSSVSHSLRVNVENLTLTGASHITGKGNTVANVIIGNSGANALYGLEGADKLYGNAGNDRLDGGTGADRMDGGVGNDIYVVDNAYDVTGEYAGEGVDTVLASSSFTLRLNVENLTLTGTAGLFGKGNALANLVIGNVAANALYGLDGNDKLYGGAGNDRLDGGTGADRMYGGVGNDIYIIDSAYDITAEYAGEGTDIVYASVNYVIRDNVERMYLTGAADLTGKGNEGANLLVGNTGANKLYGYGGNDRLYGGLGADIADGGAGNDAVDGGAGNDRLYGGLGSDVLTGGDGLDFLQGGAGRDGMYGGTGADQFVFAGGQFGGVTATSADEIHDFNRAEGDRVSLALVDANSGLSGDQAFAFIGTAAFGNSAGQLRYEQLDGNTYVQGDTNGDGVADFWIRVDGLHTLASADFVF